MCFYTRGSRIRIATKDIVCYKRVIIDENCCLSSCQKFNMNITKHIQVNQNGNCSQIGYLIFILHPKDIIVLLKPKYIVLMDTIISSQK